MSTPYRHVENARSFEPTDRYATLRTECPVHHEADHDPPFFVLSRFDDIVDAVRQHDHWLNGQGPGVYHQSGGVLGTTDEPDHSRHRRILRSAFVPTAIERLAPRITEFADALLDELLPYGTDDYGEGDWVEAFAAPLPAMAIAELLGVGDEHRDDFHRWSSDAVNALTGGDLDRYAAAKAAIEDVVEGGADERDASSAAGDTPPADVLGLLADARRAGTIDTRELRHIGYQLLVAGHETTTSLIGLLLFRLLERPEVMARLRAEPDLLPGAIEEALRFDSPVHGLFRTNAAECSVNGVTIPADSKAQMLFASANRDPARFEAPDEFRIDRERREVGRHVAFGWGIHFCIGAPLARLTTRITFERLLARTATIERAGQPVRNDSFVLHGLTRLPIRWTA